MSGSIASPTLAERARTVLATADSATVLWDAWQTERADVGEGIAADAGGDVLLRVPPRHPVAQAALGEPDGELAVAIEFTDLTAAPARDRVRSRLSLAGYLAVRGIGDLLTLRLDVAEIVVEDRNGAWPVDLDAYRAAAPDCLAAVEAEHLLHLAGRHPDALALLARLVPSRVLQGVVRVLPVALDRYGLVLRVERARGHADVRLPFREPVSAAADVGDELRRLLGVASARAACRPPATIREDRGANG